MKKFTVVVTHYNQMEYIKTALISVLEQSYMNIELIVADDCSSTFDKDKVKKIIDKYNKNNYDYKIIQGKKNVGTVKNLNNAIKKITGDYVLFFAADDKLSDNRVIENFVNEFKDSKKNVVTAQCILYDENLKVKHQRYINARKALKLNDKSATAIYEKMAEGCFYGSGGTAYRSSIFKKYGLFNEKYKFVEDWSYWLYILRSGEKMYYANFDALSHRDGGISHSTYTKYTIPPHVKQYYKDILNIYVDQVIPYLHLFNTREKYRILRQYNETILYYTSFVPELAKYLESFDNARVSDNKIKYYWKFKTLVSILNPSIFKKMWIQIKYNRVVPLTVLTWFLICLFGINNMNIKSNNWLLFSYVLAYIVTYYVVYFGYNALRVIVKKIRRV